MTGPAMLLLPGWAHTPASFEPLLAHLRPADRPRIPDSGADIPDITFPTVLVGWSLGGLLALARAANRADGIAGLVLVSSTARFCSADGYPCGLPPSRVRALMRAVRADPGEALRGFHDLCAAPANLDAAERDRRVAASLDIGAESLLRGLADLLETDLRDRLDRIRLPVLLVHGRGDAVIPHSAAEFLHARLAGSRLLTLNAAGHDIPLRFPKELAECIRTFAESLA